MKTIYILCLAGVRTGGPEALHQLSDALLEQGFPARMVYYTWEEVAALERASPGAGYSFGFRGNEVTDYDRYQKRPVSDVPSDDNSVIVLPEPLCHLAPLFNRSTVLIWWLSVDNGFGALSKVNLNHLRAPNVWHASQSIYAAKFIDAIGLNDIGMLSDYTVGEVFSFDPPSARPLTAAFNANHKVIFDLDALIARVRALDSEIICRKIVGLGHDDTMALLRASRVYVDLGNFPGKDRMPREAYVSGCEIIIGGCGGGTYPYGHRVNPFDTEKAAATIVRLVRTPPHKEAFGCANMAIFEKINFTNEVRETFAVLADAKEPAHA